MILFPQAKLRCCLKESTARHAEDDYGEAESRRLDGKAFQSASADQLDRFFARGTYAAA